MYKKCNQSDKYKQSSKSCQSDKCTCDPGTNATCTCSRTTSGDACGSSSSRESTHTSFPCAHCRDHDPNSLVRKHKYTVITTNREYDTNSNTDSYDSTSSSKGQGNSTRLWSSDESRNFKQANANSTDSVERHTGIPAGVTI